jgi:integral membrane protein
MEVFPVQAAVLRYRVMAYVTGVVLVILCFVGIPLQIAGHPAVANNVGVVHGILYMIYLVVAYLLARRLKLATGPTVLLLLAGTIPVLTFVVERWMTRKFIAPALDAPAPSHEPALLQLAPRGAAPARHRARSASGHSPGA